LINDILDLLKIEANQIVQWEAVDVPVPQRYGSSEGESYDKGLSGFRPHATTIVADSLQAR